MAKFNRDHPSGGNRKFGKPRFNSDRPDMHKATCANCGKICTVPFKPTGSKPVFCKECFQKGQGFDQNRSENLSFERRSSDDRHMYDAICANCGKHCQIPFRPTQGRDVFCSRCFDMNSGSDSRRSERKTYDSGDNLNRINDIPSYKSQFESLNEKMDRILNLLTQSSVHTSPLESEIDAKAIEEIIEDIQEEKESPIEKKVKKTKVRSGKKTDKASIK